jgi:hypothetical protein
LPSLAAAFLFLLRLIACYSTIDSQFILQGYRQRLPFQTYIEGLMSIKK